MSEDKKQLPNREEWVRKFLDDKYDPAWPLYEGDQRELFALEAFNLCSDAALVSQIFREHHPGFTFHHPADGWRDRMYELRDLWTTDATDHAIQLCLKQIEDDCPGPYKNPTYYARSVQMLRSAKNTSVKPEKQEEEDVSEINPEKAHMENDD